MKNHVHKRGQGAHTRDFGFTVCVSPGKCNPAAHGGIEERAVCTCGAERRTNINGTHLERGAWTLPRPQVGPPPVRR